MKILKIIIFVTIITSTLQSIDRKKLNRILQQIKNLENPKKAQKAQKTIKNEKTKKTERNLFMPYYYNPMMMPPQVATQISSNTSTVPPYKTIHKVAHTQNMLAIDPHMTNPYFSPFYHGISPFMGFNHFNPFMMPGGPQALNPLYSGYPGMQYMSKLPQIPAYQKGYQNANIATREDTRKLTEDVKLNLGLPGDFRQDLQDKMNLQEALGQEEMNQQLASLSGVSKEEYKDFKRIENEAEMEPENDEKENEVKMI